MHLASHQVGHHGAHWFAVTVSVTPVFTERKIVCIVNMGFTPVPLPSSALTAATGLACVTILFVCQP